MHFTLLREESPVGCAEVISLDQVTAQLETLDHVYVSGCMSASTSGFDQLESALPEGGVHLEGQVSEISVWTLRQQLTSGVAETIVQHTHQEEQHRPRICPVLHHVHAG